MKYLVDNIRISILENKITNYKLRKGLAQCLVYWFLLENPGFESTWPLVLLFLEVSCCCLVPKNSFGHQ